MIIGAQLYTVRDFCKTTEDFAETLKKVADIGYTTVQVSGTCGYEADWLAGELKKNGLHCGITHTNYGRILQETDKVIAEHTAFGCDYIGIGGFFGGVENLENFAAEAMPAARKMRDAGKLFMYHNHGWEYENKCADGRSVMEHLAELFPADVMGFTLDAFWVRYGGYDPISEIHRLRGRLPCVHLKDMWQDGDVRKMAWIGGGNCMDYAAIPTAFADAGTKYAYVEQDDCNGEDPFVCLRRSYDYLHALGWN